MTVLLMSDGELSRLEVLRDLDRRRLTTATAGQLLGLERRQVFRLLKAYMIEGPTGLISKRRGRRSNRRKPEGLRRAVVAIIRQWYWDFGPTLAAEKLREDHGIALGRETLRQWDLHQPLRAGDDLDDAFAWKEERTLSQALTLQYDKILFILEPTDQAKAAIGKRGQRGRLPRWAAGDPLQGPRTGVPDLR